MKRMNKKGFTLVELLVVLAILGLLAGIGIPQYMKVLENSKIAVDNATAAGVESVLRAYYADAGEALPVTDIADLGALSLVSLLTGKSETFTDYYKGSTSDTLPTEPKAKTHKGSTLKWTGSKVEWVKTTGD